MRRLIVFAVCVSLGLVILVHRIRAAEGTVDGRDPGQAMQALMASGQLPKNNPPLGKTAEVEFIAPTGTQAAWTGTIKKITASWIVLNVEQQKSTVWVPISRVEYVRVMD
jgi:hypothetical protein